jgi:DNA-binding transcriptional ArsR family regulator
MMEGLGEQLEHSLGTIAGLDADIRVPHLRVRKGRKKRRKRDVEKIPPERVADVISPLGSVERLKILEYLKDGSKSFNELENYIGKTGSSLTHHLNPLLDAGYVIKGEVRGTYYVTVEGSLAYRLAQWLTGQLEHERKLNGVKEKKLAAVSMTADSPFDDEQEVKLTIDPDDEEDELE